MDELGHFGLDLTSSHHIRRHPTDGNLNKNNIIIICGEHLDTSTSYNTSSHPWISFWSPCFLFTLWTLPPPCRSLVSCLSRFCYTPSPASKTVICHCH
jgi:hypothetical protein